MERVIRLITILFVKYLLPKHQFKMHDVIKTDMGDTRYVVMETYYNEKLEPILIVTDKDGKMFSMNEKELVRVG